MHVWIPFKFIVFCGAIVLINLIHNTPTYADDIIPSPSSELPINFAADQMDVDQELGIVTARGNVEVVYDQRNLFADTISYNKKSDILTASGNIVLMEPSGDVTFAEHMEISGDFKNGIVQDIRMILSDRSRLAANKGIKRNEDLELHKAVYSPCEPCVDSPSGPPIWQLKAVKVFHDKSQQSVEYTDAWLEIAGVPVIYTPYLSHPDPTVKRKSGFLAPSFGSHTGLGATLKTPYFWNMSPQHDITIEPAFYGDAGIGISGEYRKLFHDGHFEMISSLAADDSTYEGHIDGFGRFDIDETWRWGFDTWAATEDTYLRRYGFRSEQTLSNDIYAEGFRGSNYFRGEGFIFQSMEANDDEAETPITAPLLTFQHVGHPDRYGGHSRLDASLVSLYRDDGTDVQRLSLSPGWESNYLSSSGDLFRLALTLDSDIYYIQDYTPIGNSSEFSGVSGRILPQVQLDWSKPYVKAVDAISQVIEPKISLIMSPNGSNPSNISNEDSMEFEFDETSLFGSNKFSGHDRVESGTRIDYGVHSSIHGRSGGKATAFVGQSYRFREESQFPQNSGLEDNVSDVIAAIQITPERYVTLNHRTRIGKSNAEIQRSEFDINAGVPLFTFDARYLFFERQEESEFGGREDIVLGFRSRFSRFWRSSGHVQRDLADEDTRSIDFNVTYEDECLVFDTKLSRTFYHDRDLEPNDTIMFTVNFKTLGGISADVF